jgi:hypothetical protein
VWLLAHLAACRRSVGAGRDQTRVADTSPRESRYREPFPNTIGDRRSPRSGTRFGLRGDWRRKGPHHNESAHGAPMRAWRCPRVVAGPLHQPIGHTSPALQTPRAQTMEKTSHRAGSPFGGLSSVGQETGIRSLYDEFVRAYGIEIGLYCAGFRPNSTYKRSSAPRSCS